jgi:hypothetical protein
MRLSGVTRFHKKTPDAPTSPLPELWTREWVVEHRYAPMFEGVRQDPRLERAFAEVGPELRTIS